MGDGSCLLFFRLDSFGSSIVNAVTYGVEPNHLVGVAQFPINCAHHPTYALIRLGLPKRPREGALNRMARVDSESCTGRGEAQNIGRNFADSTDLEGFPLGVQVRLALDIACRGIRFCTFDIRLDALADIDLFRWVSCLEA